MACQLQRTHAEVERVGALQKACKRITCRSCIEEIPAQEGLASVNLPRWPYLRLSWQQMAVSNSILVQAFVKEARASYAWLEKVLPELFTQPGLPDWKLKLDQLCTGTSSMIIHKCEAKGGEGEGHQPSQRIMQPRTCTSR